jgi:hypothetical protein
MSDDGANMYTKFHQSEMVRCKFYFQMCLFSMECPIVHFCYVVGSHPPAELVILLPLLLAEQPTGWHFVLP